MPHSVPQARPEDVSSIDGIIKAFYEIVSGHPGIPRDRDRTLYIKGVSFVSVGLENERGLPTTSVMTHDEFIQHSHPITVRV